MKIIQVRENQLKSITEFLIAKEIIFHPVISPSGCPDFTDFLGRKYLLIFDRNILTNLIELCIKGSIKDKYILKVISSLMFWAEFNNVNITSGLALNEYANHKQDDLAASWENNIFLNSFDYYSPDLWLALATGETQEIPKLQLSEEKIQDFVFNIESDHFKMHYAEMLYIMQLYFKEEMSGHEKVIDFLQWNNENLLFCCYTITYISLLFSNKLKNFKTNDIETILNKCHNQAWDITYLSIWSTLYWDELDGDTTYLFATMDKDLKKVFINTHDTSSSIFARFFGEVKGSIIQKEYDKIIKSRVKPEISEDFIDEIIALEKEKLIDALKVSLK